MALVVAPNSADAVALASTKRAPSPQRARIVRLDPLGGQIEVGPMREVAGEQFGAVDDDGGRAGAHRRQRRFGAGGDEIAAEHEVGFAGPDPHRVDVFRPRRDLDVAEDRAALLRQAGHVDRRRALAFEMRRHRQHGADRHHAGSADAADQDRVGPGVDARQNRVGAGRRRRFAAARVFGRAPSTVTNDGQKPSTQE